jgi:anti-anti-sigma factor
MSATGMSAHSLGEFELGIDFAIDRVILRVRGEVDRLTAPALGAVLRVLVDRGDSALTLDLAAITFMDASGLGVIAETSERLASSSRMLTVRSAPPMTRRILGITRLDELIRLEDEQAIEATLGAEQSEGDHSLVVERVNGDLPLDPAGVRSKTSTSMVDATLRLVTVLADATVGGADGVSVTLERHGRFTTVASSNDTVLRMDQHQYETGEGPCLAAATQGHWFHIQSLAEEDRWPSFVPRAMDEGIASILSTPLMAGERSVGALNIYSNSERAFGPEQQELAAMFASQASGILTDSGIDISDEQRDTRVSDALVAREVIAQAQGMLMSGQHLNAEDAANSLYRSARTARVTVRRHAASIVASAHSNTDPRDEVPNG